MGPWISSELTANIILIRLQREPQIFTKLSRSMTKQTELLRLAWAFAQSDQREEAMGPWVASELTANSF